MSEATRILEILRQAKRLAQEYRALTGKPLGVTGEVAEYEAALHLDLELAPARQAGYDAVRRSDGARLQIKGRCVPTGANPGQRMSRIDINKEFDAVLLVILDENFDTTEIYEADRAAVIAAITAPGSRARNEKGALPIAKVKSIGHSIWRRQAAQA